MRLIDADALIAQIEAETNELVDRTEYQFAAYVAIHEINNAPTIEQERKTGHWVWDENGMDWGLGAWRCSECGIKAETWWANDKKYNPLKCSGGNFCGICGADMRGEQNG